MAVTVTPLILSLLNDSDESPVRNSKFWKAFTKIEPLYDEWRDGLVASSIQGEGLEANLNDWYESSVLEDNFIRLFNEEGGVDLNNFIVPEYAKLIRDKFDGEVFESNPADWKAFFETKIGNNELGNFLYGYNTDTELRKNYNLSREEAESQFKDMTLFSTTKSINKILGKSSSTAKAVEILEAWSFYLSMINWIATEKELEKIPNIQKLEDSVDQLTLLDFYLDLSQESGRATAAARVGARIAAMNTARSALKAGKFNKQKYLIENIDDFSRIAINRRNRIGIEQDRILRFKNSKKNAVNKLTGAAAGREMFKLSNVQLSKLVPKIKLSKLFYDKNMAKTGEVELEFPTTFAGGEMKKEDIDPLRSSTKRYGYGIKSFSWEYKGSDPFSVDRDITATLVLYFQDFAEFTKKRENKNGFKYRYVDLLIPLERDYPQLKGILGEQFQQNIRVQAGWEVPRTLEKELELAKATPESIYGPSFVGKAAKDKVVKNFAGKLASIKASQVDLVLHPLDYSISFDGNGNGASTVTIDYRARIESVGKNRLINVIGATEDEVKAVRELEDDINATDKNKEKEDLRKKQQNLYKKIKSEASKRFIEKLGRNSSIYWRYANLEEVMVSMFGKDDAKKYYELIRRDTFNPKYKDGLQESLAQLDANSALTITDLILTKDVDIPPNDIGDDRPEKIMYTFLGDIFQVAIETAAETGAFQGAPQDVIRDFKVALLDFRAGDKTFNLCNLPVEMGVFTEFLNNKIGKRNEYTKSFISFARELLSEVLINRIDEYLNLKDGTTRSFKIGYIEMNRNLKPNSERSYNLGLNSDVAFINKRPKQDFLVIYSDTPMPSDFKIKDGEYQIKKNDDEANGLHHFALGTTRSIAKNISFDKLDLEYAKERRMTLNQEDPYALLANVFNVNISMFGNNFFRPGSYIYVDPKVMGDLGNPYTKGTIANSMGLGGYHIVTSVSHTINLQSYETSLDAVWETSGDGESSFNTIKTDKKNPKGDKKK